MNGLGFQTWTWTLFYFLFFLSGLAKRSITEKYEQFLQQGGTYWAYGGGQYLLPRTQRENEDWLKNRRSKDDKMFREVWKAVKTKTEEVRMAEAKREREKEGEREETRRKN